MKSPLRIAAIATIAGLVAAPIASAATAGADLSIFDGSLGVTTPSFQPLNATLTGADQSFDTTPANPWAAIDSRGTGAAWSAVATATDLVSAGTPNRVIPSARIAFTTGTITPAPGADPATGMTGSTAAPFTTPTGPGQTTVTVVNAPGPHRGVYDFTPTLSVTIPAAAEPSYGGSPYVATLTITIS